MERAKERAKERMMVCHNKVKGCASAVVSQGIQRNNAHKNARLQEALALLDGVVAQHQPFQNRKFLVKGHT